MKMNTSQLENTSAQPKVSLKPDQTATRELVRRNKTIAEHVMEVVPQMIERPNNSFTIPYDDKADDDAKRRAYKAKVRAELGKALNARKKMLARSLFISEGDSCIEVFLQDFDAL